MIRLADAITATDVPRTGDMFVCSLACGLPIV
jgi:hypothetical protein